MLTNFRNLRNVTLRVESLVNKEYTADNERIDVNLIVVHKNFFDLLFNKEDASLKKMIFVVEVYSILLSQEKNEDDLSSLREDLRIFHCENDDNIEPVVHEKTLLSMLNVNMQLWKLDTI